MILLKSEFGYIPKGVLQNACDSSNLLAACNEVDLSTFWDFESHGICDYNSTNDVAMQHFNNTVEFENGRYIVSWPWLDENRVPPDTYLLALGRLKSLMKRLSKSPELVEKYDNVIKEQLELNMIEEVSNKDEQDGIVHYLPHHSAVKEASETIKLHVVFDASAKTNANADSLNDCLYKEPNLLLDLHGMLLRFRMKPIALMSDAPYPVHSCSLQLCNIIFPKQSPG